MNSAAAAECPSLSPVTNDPVLQQPLSKSRPSLSPLGDPCPGTAHSNQPSSAWRFSFVSQPSVPPDSTLQQLANTNTEGKKAQLLHNQLADTPSLLQRLPSACSNNMGKVESICGQSNSKTSRRVNKS